MAVLRLIALLLLVAACSGSPVEPDGVPIVEVDVRIAKLHRFADDILVNELEIWAKEGYVCEKKYVFTDEIDLGGGLVGIILKELHACWRISIS